MRVRDIMSPGVISVAPDANILEAVRLMLENRVSGLPVVDRSGVLVGVVTEGDFVRRSETGTERRRPRWLEFFIGPGRLADEYVRTHARRVKDAMTREPVTVGDDAGLEEAVELMERRGIKRLVVVARTGVVVGMVSRADLLQALITVASAPPLAMSDGAIREALLAEFATQAWAPAALVEPVVRDGVVELRGTITEEAQREALKVCAAGMPGVKSVVSRLTWVEPLSGMAIGESEISQAEDDYRVAQ